MTDDRPTYTLVLRPDPGVDAIRALRFGLKILKRRLGLTAVTVTEQAPQPKREKVGGSVYPQNTA